MTIENAYHPEYKGSYLRLVDGNSEAEKKAMLIDAVRQAIDNPTRMKES